jgi:hypothetical protein
MAHGIRLRLVRVVLVAGGRADERGFCSSLWRAGVVGATVARERGAVGCVGAFGVFERLVRACV